eukprot:TRINITY_DN122207_c0_g1_i1.p1 TRINITY_DN122207_c0_g1~~TRINITY_DN122207_c0_g1_i1.p1  ORF type:complete len:429 (+),score=68.58 TRINITY_DN122207_c0_g1_i1:119-1405(+)
MASGGYGGHGGGAKSSANPLKADVSVDVGRTAGGKASGHDPRKDSTADRPIADDSSAHAPTFELIVELPGLAETLASFAGVMACCRLIAAGQLVHEVMALFPHTLARLYPPRIFVFGGHAGARAPGIDALPCDRVDACSAGERWEALSPMPAPRLHASAATVAGFIYIVGGRGMEDMSLDTVDRYSASSGCWQQAPSLLQARSRCAIAAVGGVICVAGGDNGAAQTLASAECLLKPASEPKAADFVWQPLPPLKKARSCCAGARMGGAFVVAGGADNGYRALHSVEKLQLRRSDGAEPVWQPVGPGGRMLRARFQCAAASVPSGVLVAGGVVDGWAPLDAAEAYDRSSNEWYEVNAMMASRRDFAMVTAAGFVYVFGGVSYGAKCTRCVERSKVGLSWSQERASGDWQEMTKMPDPARCGIAAAASWS